MSSVLSVEQIKLLFGKSRDAVFFMEKVNEDYRYIYVNEAATKLIDMDPTGKQIEQVVPSHIAKNIINFYNLTLKNNDQVEYEDYIYAKMEVSKRRTTMFPIHDDDGQYILAITKEVVMSRDVEDKYLFMRSLFFKSFLSTVLISNDMQLLEADPEFVEDFQLQLDAPKGTTIFDMPFIEQQSIPELKDYLERAQKGDIVTSKILNFIDKNGQMRNFTATFSSLTSNDEVFAVFIIMQEITNFVKQRQELVTASHGLQTFKNAISSVADVIFTDQYGVIIDINNRVVENTGYSREELIGKTHAIFSSGHHSQAFFANLWQTIQKGEIWHDEVCNRKKNGEIYWVDSTILPIKNECGTIVQFLTVQHNISSNKRLTSELYKIEQTFRAITENTNDFIVITNQHGEIKYASPSYMRKLDYTEQELIGQPYECLLTPESKDIWRQVIQQPGLKMHQEQKIELQMRTKADNPIWAEGNYTISLDLSEQEVTEIVMVSREITERKELEDRLTFLAYHDSLTQLGNRRKLFKDFPNILEKAKQMNTSLAIFFLDGDNFKQVNDLHGHDVGDEFLKRFGQALLKSVRSDDLVIRIGGDEFLIVVTGLSSDAEVTQKQIEHIVERIKYHLTIGWEIRDVHFSPTTSIGIALYPNHGDDIDTLMDKADRALYEVKQQAKNCYCIFGKQIIK